MKAVKRNATRLLLGRAVRRIKIGETRTEAEKWSGGDARILKYKRPPCTLLLPSSTSHTSPDSLPFLPLDWFFTPGTFSFFFSSLFFSHLFSFSSSLDLNGNFLYPFFLLFAFFSRLFLNMFCKTFEVEWTHISDDSKP